MFNFFKKHEVKADNKLYAPVNGAVIDLSTVNDPVFAGKAMGDGFAMIPASGDIVSPVAGTVTLVADTKHAVGLKTAAGVEILLHLGLDTVNLGGKPFAIKVKVGDILDGGDKIGDMDLAQIKAGGYDNTVMVIATNMDAVKAISSAQGTFQAGDAVGEVTPV